MPAANDGAETKPPITMTETDNNGNVAVAKKRNMKELLLFVCVFAAADVRIVNGLPEPSAGLGDEVRKFPNWFNL